MAANVMNLNRLNQNFEHDVHQADRSQLPHADPLCNSNRTTLPFPHRAATTLAEQRGKRYDDPHDQVEDVERRFRELASIMGMYSDNDDMPTAA